MTSWQIVRVFAGLMILVSLALGMSGSPLFVSPWWLLLVGFAGANLIQAGLTGFCPAAMAFKALGAKPGCAFQ